MLMPHADRQRKLRRAMGLGSGDAWLVQGREDIRYCIGFDGSAGTVLIDRSSTVLFVDGRYVEAGGRSAAGLVIPADDWIGEVAAYCRSARVKRLVFDGGDMSFAIYRRLAESLAGVELVPAAENAIKIARMVKDDVELALLRANVRRAKAAFARFVGAGSMEGRSEREMCRELEYALACAGDAVSFPAIVASGRNASLPHAVPGSRRVRRDDVVLFDFGLRRNGYCTDATRTVTVGAGTRLHERYRPVLDAAFAAALRAIRHGSEIAGADKAVRACFESHGVLDRFKHSTGHGVGLAVHELPSVSYRTKGVFREGMVVTVEPGLYFEGRYGVRHEEMVVVTRKGCEIL